MIPLEDLGYFPYFSAQFELLPERLGWVPARVMSESHGIYQLAGCRVERGELAGRLRAELGPLERPAPGDWVAVSDTASPALIQQVLDRRTLLKRRAANSDTATQIVAANVDWFFIVTSANEELNLRRLERYLAAVWDSGASPLVVLNKADLVDDPTSLLAAIEGVAPGCPIVPLSALSGFGIDQVYATLKHGTTVALIGSSGVGKSTLINRLLGTDSQATANVGWDGKGRHTTSTRQLRVLAGSALLLDTPGMREFGMTDTADGLECAFADIRSLAEQCRFRDCQHASEPKCAVRAAAERGLLSLERLESYHKLKREIRAIRSRQDPLLAATVKRQRKSFARASRARARQDRKRQRDSD